MTKTKNILPEFWRYLEAQDTKISSKVYSVLNKDKVGAIIVDHNAFWIESRYPGSVPDYVHKYIVSWGKRQGYDYLYEKIIELDEQIYN